MSSVTLPYSINGINGHSSGYSKGTYNFTTTINLYKVQPTYLWFQHADQSADIYVDNVKVTTHWGGYAAFFTDITNYVHVGTNNIKVAVCNTTRNAIAPADGDFNFNATLGKVKVLTSPVLPSVDYGYDGFHVKATNISSSAATITIKTNVPAGATLICKIDDSTSNYHFREKKPSTGSEVTFTTTIQNPILWDGTINPHLYNITLEIYKNGDLYHKYERGYGIRYYEYVINDTVKVGTQAEPYTGFLLNGHKYLLRGVCMHHDIDGKANALSDADIAHDFELIQELGCNFIRLAHYPHPKEVYDWCDRLGIIVQTEGPCVNKFNKCVSDGGSWTDDYYTHLYTQYEDMVRQHFNHPCILFWGLFNEATTDDKSWAKTKLENYKAFIKNIDPERWVGYVVSHSYSDPSDVMGRPDMDWFGCNIYVGWYIDQNSNDPTNQLNKRVKSTITNLSKPLAYSEYGCGGTSTCHSENYLQTTTRGNNPRHDIEYQMWLHEGHIAAIRNFPELLFTGQWQLFDIAVSKRQEGYKVCLDNETVTDNNNLKYLNNKGLIERDHITKKDTFYLYKAWWNQTDKFVHICGKNYEKYENRVIKCYTNDPDSGTLKLYVNDVLVETATVTDNIATFTARTYADGAVIRVDGDTASDTLTIPLNYLTFTVKSDGTILWKKDTSSSSPSKTISYSKNGGEWTNLTSSSGGASISVTTGDKVRFKGENSAYGTSSYYNYFGGTATFDVSGNIMSLVGGDNYSVLTTPEYYAFKYLFYNCTGVLSAEKLKLPIGKASFYTYDSMFYGCTGLTTAPELPATSLDTGCYTNMFEGCTNLTTAPKLPATTLNQYCYDCMFKGCTSLTTAPVLPATNLFMACYRSMFYGCTGLTTAPVLPATTLAESCYRSMFQNCTSLTTAPELPATTLAESCYRNMFQNCTSLTTAPELPATTLAESCYRSMFNSCTSLTTAPELPATTLASNCYRLMFQNCTSLTTAPELPATTLTESCYHIMFNGCTSLTTAPELPATTLADSCYYQMFSRCTSLTTAPELPATTLTENCYRSMFQNCTSLTTAPELPATTLTENCYYYMFSDCTSLSSIKCLATNISASGCTSGWVNNVAASGTFVKKSGMTGWTTNENGIPVNWTVQLAQ